HLPPQDTGAFITKESLDTNFRSAPEIIRFNNYLYRVLPAEVQAYLNQQVEKELPEAHYVQAWQGRGLDTTVLRAYEGSEQVVPAHRRHQPAGSVFLEFLRDEEAVDDGGAGILGMNQFRARACERVYEQLC